MFLNCRKLTPNALKGQKLLAQGSTLGIMAISKACDENLRKLRSKCFGVPIRCVLQRHVG